MQILKKATCGTLQSNDCLISVEASNCLEIEIESSVKNEFGEHIEHLIKETLKDLKLENIKLKIEDKGALDCTIVARLETVIQRALEG